MIIRIALLLMFAALAVFISVDLLPSPVAPEFMTQLGLAALLSAFGLLVAAGLALIVKRSIKSLTAYFSAGQRLQRRLWFIQANED